ncbi:MAG: hypothetical protein AAF968_15885 [Pseudomonadota bacterium]
MADRDDAEMEARARRAKRHFSQEHTGRGGAGLRQEPDGTWIIIVYVTDGMPEPEDLPTEIDGFAVRAERIGPIKPL